jgi:predicted phosphodiesterase
MRFAIFSDLHGNLPALEGFIQNTSYVDGYICLGDIVNYGPWGNECVQLINTIPSIVTIKGNHELYFLNNNYPGFNFVAKTFFETCIKDFTEYNTISKFSNSYQLGNYDFQHTINNQYIFHDTNILLDRNIVIGHSHQQFDKVLNGFRLVNPGSLGQNRRYINKCEYMIFDLEKNTFESRNFIYNHTILIQEMKSRNYPTICIEYYQKKHFI